MSDGLKTPKAGFCKVGLMLCLLLESGCAATHDDGLAAPYQTWDDVVDRWIGKPKPDLFLELGPPQFHKEAEDGSEQLVWDMTLPGMPGNAQRYNTLPLYGGVACKLVFYAAPSGEITSGNRVGCD